MDDATRLKTLPLFRGLRLFDRLYPNFGLIFYQYPFVLRLSLPSSRLFRMRSDAGCTHQAVDVHHELVSVRDAAIPHIYHLLVSAQTAEEHFRLAFIRYPYLQCGYIRNQGSM